MTESDQALWEWAEPPRHQMSEDVCRSPVNLKWSAWNRCAMLRAIKSALCRPLPITCRPMSAQTLPLAKGIWQVSSYGRWCNLKGIIGLGSLHPSGYRVVQLAEQNWYVHRVVKLTFYGLPEDQSAWQIHHRDGNKANNRLENLEFVSNSVNVKHSHADPSRGCGRSKLWKPVLWRPLGSEIWQRYASVTRAAEQLGMAVSTISRCCTQRSSAKGFEFRFEKVLESALEGEQWRSMLDPATGTPVPGRMVSSLGRVRLKNGFTYYGSRFQSGYFQTSIYESNGIKKCVLVHRLVAAAFLGPPPTPERCIVNHKDGNKGNNVVGNLEYATQADNISYYFALACGGKSTTSNSAAKPVWSRACGSEDGWEWHASMNKAANVLGLKSGSVSACTRGLIKQAGSYEFWLADVPDNMPLPGEEWRPIDFSLLLKDKARRRKAAGLV